MVSVRSDRPLDAQGRVDVELWLDSLEARSALRDRARMQAACDLASTAAERPGSWSRRDGRAGTAFETGLEMVDILVELRADEEALVAAVLYRVVREDRLALTQVRDAFGDRVADLIEGVLRMAAVSALKLGSVPKAIGEPAEQLEKVRRMLVALVDDVRVALIKLAERTCALRAAKHDPLARRQRIAREVSDVYAPLAHRLGIGQLRWELEDLSFRYLEPEAYKRIASLLAERREARQQYVDDVVRELAEELDGAGIRARITGRPKHIYSIWRKMRAKAIGFSEVYDVHAVRVLVDDIRDCYAALGIVHGLWRHVPQEFDDYVAMPKENGYRSIHTAVLGPEGRHVEVQIRTQDMHDEAELGVCAHWAYKHGEGEAVGPDDASYDEKVAWLRQVLEWQEELGDLEGLGDALRRDFRQERIYVLTPDGHVLDLAPGATPLDYAYRIHTEVGHRCRAARVGGVVVPLSHALKTGDAVEIVTDDDAEPSLDWLNPALGYLKTSRARAKVQAFFRARPAERSVADGRALADALCERLAIPQALLPRIARLVGLGSEDALYAALGAGRTGRDAILRAVDAEWARERAGQMQLLPSAEGRGADAPGPKVLGAGTLPLWFADCCAPGPTDAIVGLVAVGHGVAVHRADCREALARERRDEGSLIRLRWGEDRVLTRAFDLRIDAYDRPGLLHEITSVFAEAEIDVSATSLQTDRATSTATLQLTVEVSGLEALGGLMDRIASIENVYRIRRIDDRDGHRGDVDPARASA